MASPSAIAALRDIVGKDNLAEAEEASCFRAGGIPPSLCAVFPSSIEEVQEVVRVCATERLSVIPLGSGTMAFRCSAPDSFGVALDTRRMNMIVEHQKENLVVAVQPGVTGAQIVDLLSPHRQMLALDPVRFRDATLGGVVSARAAGPSRMAYGAPRDLVLGLKVVDAAGKVISSGGRVMKNAAGYDLCKLFTGSLGTLGIIVEAAFRLHPIPDQSVALIGIFTTWEHCDKALARINTSLLLPRALEVLNTEAARAVCPDGTASQPVYLIALFDGTGEQLDCQRQMFSDILDQTNALDSAELPAEWHSPFHTAICNLEDCPAGGSLFVAQGLPSDVPVVARSLADEFAARGGKARIAASAGNGIVRAACDGLSLDAHHAIRKATAAKLAGIRGMNLASFRHEPGRWEDVWSSPPPGIEPMRAIRRSLDPNAVFPAGRYVGGI